MDITDIMGMLKQRYPFLMVDRILEYSEDHVVGYKNVTINEPFFQGHFPGDPVMPGVMILESMGQVASIMVSVRLGKDLGGKIAFLAGVDGARFRKPVRPGDQLLTRAELTRLRGPIGKTKVKAYVDDEIVAECEFMFMVGNSLDKADKNDKKAPESEE
ncbi:MAG: 3-hydroxyacyl-ACP dehydratase FabZ [Fretibacterium sp.]|nr:3-hydroxyacyl-ACP dehydratase FabZ [Fretibacterium sp.]